MYKAGDFTNGKMNEIFKQASQRLVAERYDLGDNSYGSFISHKQFGDFILVSDDLLAVKCSSLYATITGGTIEGFYDEYGDGTFMANENQLHAVNHLLFPCGYDHKKPVSWSNAYFMLSDRLCSIISNLDKNPCSKYMELITNV